MSIINKLASSLNRRDEVPNQELAKEIATTGDTVAAKELFKNLSNKDKGIQSDCIKVIYEIGEQQPKLIAGFAGELVALLDNKNNRLQWGAMTALDSITNESPAVIYAVLAKIIDVADKGSVITNDHCMGILTKLCAVKKYSEDAFALLNERLLSSPVNQLAMYAERAIPIINNTNKIAFITTLTARLTDMVKESQRKRIEKVLKQLQKK